MISAHSGTQKCANEAPVHRGAPQLVWLKSVKVWRRADSSMDAQCKYASSFAPQQSRLLLSLYMLFISATMTSLTCRTNGNNRVHMFALVLADNAPECGAPAVASQSTMLISGVRLEQALSNVKYSPQSVISIHEKMLHFAVS